MLTAKTLTLYRELKASDPAFRDGATMCDLGNQVVKLGKAHPWNKCLSGWYMQKEYNFGHCLAIDINGDDGALQLDLNFATAKQVGHTFDVVANHGTTEHCLNQLNCFTLMHDLTNVGGLMIHYVPSWPHNVYDTCFFFMSCTVFDNIAEANDYECVRLELVDDKNGKYVMAVLRKTRPDAFVVPVDRNYHLPGKTISVPA